jgi:hypothetical protein
MCEIDWEILSEGKCYIKDWDAEIVSIDSDMVEDAISWLGGV